MLLRIINGYWIILMNMVHDYHLFTIELLISMIKILVIIVNIVVASLSFVGGYHWW